MANTSHPPSWEILNLISHYLDPQTLAIASCVNKSWLKSMSSDHIWKPICFTHFPSLSKLHQTHPTISYRHLYTIGYRSSISRHTFNPPPPKISINDIFFSIDVFSNDSQLFGTSKDGKDLVSDPFGLFRFDFEFNSHGEVKENDELRVRWNVVLKGWRGVFMVMDCKEKGRSVSGDERWFSQELPSVGCCCSTSGHSGIVAELGLGMSKEGCVDDMVKISKVRVSFLSVVNCRYLGIDDALRYLQRFLLPSYEY
ncbi:hypothetical protein ACHQM5_001801 [Ranunculus cassubicifolius]